MDFLKTEDLDYGDFETEMKKYDEEKKSELENSDDKNKSFVGKLFSF